MNAVDYRNELLRDLRTQRGLSMEEVASQVNKTRMMIHYAEKGIRCSYKLLKALANLYGIPVSQLLREAAASPGKNSAIFLPDTVKTS